MNENAVGRAISEGVQATGVVERATPHTFRQSFATHLLEPGYDILSVEEGTRMDVANRQQFLACLDRYPDRNGLEVFAHANAHLLAAVEEVGFSDFIGHDYEVVGRVSEALFGRDTKACCPSESSEQGRT